jgi:hypothetical protein
MSFAPSSAVSPFAYRSITAIGVASCLIASHVLITDGATRAHHQYLFVTALGYGHLFGAARGAWQAARSAPIRAGFTGVSTATGFALYQEALSRWPGVAFALLALSVWHFTENDAALTRALRRQVPLGPMLRGVRAHAAAFGAAACVVAAALLVSPDPGLLGDLFAATTLFHLLGWCVFLFARGTGLGTLLLLHATPLVLCAWLTSSSSEWLDPLRRWLFTPGVYLYWASLHTVHTVWMRRAAG